MLRLLSIAFCLIVPSWLYAQTPKAGFKVNGKQAVKGETIQLCVGSSLNFASTATNANYFNWTFASGTPTASTAANPLVTYNNAGTFKAVQNVTYFLNGQKDSLWVFVQVNKTYPTADFSYAPATLECGSKTFSFSNKSTGNGLSYSWNFGDGSTSNFSNPTHVFDKATGSTGNTTYNVLLTVTNNAMCQADTAIPVTVINIPDINLVSADPTVTFAPFNGSATFRKCVNIPSYEFSFVNKSSTAATNTGYTIKWGDGTPDSSFASWDILTPIKHVYKQGNTVTTVSIKGSNGCDAVQKFNVFLGSNPAAGFASLGSTEICAPDSLRFVINGYASNAPGTLYTVSINDGSAPVTFVHPPLDTISHTFDRTSCSVSSSNGSQTFSNSFRTTLDAENPCGSTSLSVIPIYVSGKPTAIISAAPSNKVCVNTTVTLSNGGSYGGKITATGGGNSVCENIGTQVWAISPATGYTITNGSMGSVNGFSDNAIFWTNGTPKLDVKFTVPGKYIVKFYVSNDRCGIDSTVDTICVRLPPDASFLMDKKEACAPAMLMLNNTSTVGDCDGEKFLWDVTFSDIQACGTINNASFENGTTASSRNASLGFATAGKYLVQLTVTAQASGCAPATISDTFSVKAIPKISIGKLAAVCAGNSVLPQASINNCYSSQPLVYNWQFAGGTPASATTANPGPVVYSAVGNYVATLSVTSECGSSDTSAPIQITSLPTANAGRDTLLCSGSPATMGNNTAGYTYQWSPAAFLNNPQLANPTVTPLYSGTAADTTIAYTCKVSAGAGCEAFDTVLVTVKPSPTVLVQAAVSAICPGDSVILTASGADSYNWQPAGSFTLVNASQVKVSPLFSQVFSAFGQTANGCTGTGQITISVKTLSPVNAGSNQLTCNNASSLTLSGSPAGGSWSGNAFLAANGIFSPALAGNGVYPARYSYAQNGCTVSDSILITVTDAPVSSAGNDQRFCASPLAVQLTGTPQPGTWSGTIVSPAGLANVSKPGVYALVYEVGSGTCMGRDTVSVTVYDSVSNNSIAGVAAICSGNIPAVIKGSLATAGSLSISFQWQQSTDGFSWATIAGAQSRDYQPAALFASAWFRRLAATPVCQPGSSSNAIQVLVNQDAVAALAPPKTTSCAPFILDNAAVNLQPDNTQNSIYTWLINGKTAATGAGFPGYTITAAPDSVTVTVIASSRFGCRPDTATEIFRTLPVPAPAFTLSDTTGCGPLHISIVNTTPNATAFTYTWNFGTGQTSNALQPGVIDFPPNPFLGDTLYRVSLKAFAGCDSIEAVHFVRVKGIPRALFTPSKTIGCSPMEVVFTNYSQGSNAFFTWDFGDGSAIVKEAGSTVKHQFTAAVLDTFLVTLSGENECGKDRRQYAIVVNPNAIQLKLAVNGNQLNGCAPQDVLFINNTRGANLFRWNFGDGSPELITTKGIDSVWHTYTQKGIYLASLFATNSCSDTSTSLTITVENKPAVSFTPAVSSICIGQPLTLSNTSEAGLGWQWDFGDGSTSSVRNPVKIFSRPGSYRVTLIGSKRFAQGFGCSASAYTDVLVRDTLPGSFTLDSAGSCVPMVVTLKNDISSATTVNWNFGDGSVGNGTSLVHTYFLPGQYKLLMTAREAGGCVYQASKTIRANGPSGELRYTGGYTCLPASVALTAISNNTTEYHFYFGNGDSLVNSTGLVNYTYPRPGVYLPSVLLVSGNCSRLVKGADSIRVEKLQAAFSLVQDHFCGSTVLRLRDSSSSYFGTTGWNWDFGDGTGSSLQNPSKTIFAAGDYAIQLKATTAGGCSSETRIPITVAVNTKPASQITIAGINCTLNTIAFAANTIPGTGPVTYQWNFGNGISATGPAVTHVYSVAGTYNVLLITRAATGCVDTASRQLVIQTASQVQAGADVKICLGQSAPLLATGGDRYTWSPQQGLSCAFCASPVASPNATTRYIMTGYNSLGCSTSDTILVEVVQPFTISVSPSDSICIGQSAQLVAYGADNYRWSPPAGLSASNIFNPIARPQNSTRYTVVGSDNFNCFTDTASVTIAVGQYPVVDLGLPATVVAGTQVNLTPVITNGPITRYQWTPTASLSCTDCAFPVATILQNTTYQLTVTNAYGCSGTDTVTYQVLCNRDDQVYIPNAFSPDGDGINDVFMMHGKGIEVVYFKVFNRWGQVVFDGGSNYRPNLPQYGWNGRINGKPATQDIYVFMAEVKCVAGGTFTYKGNVSLLFVR